MNIEHVAEMIYPRFHPSEDEIKIERERLLNELVKDATIENMTDAMIEVEGELEHETLCNNIQDAWKAGNVEEYAGYWNQLLRHFFKDRATTETDDWADCKADTKQLEYKNAMNGVELA